MSGNLTRIKNNQITDLTVNAAAKLQDYTVTSTKLANSLVYGSDLTVSGNLTVNGTTTTIDTINTLIEDPIVTLADGQTSGSPTVDIGVLGLRGSQNNSFLGWNEGNTEFAAILTTTSSSNTTVAITSYGNFHANDIKAGGNLSVAGNIIGSANFTGNVTAGNLLTPGVVSAAGNVTGGNVNTGGQVSAAGDVSGNNIYGVGVVSTSGNVTGGNVLTAGLISATGNVTGGNLDTSGTVSATANITGGNILTAGIVSAAGNITANPSSFFIGNGSQLTGVAADTATALTNGTTNLTTALNGNANLTIGGTSNVVVWATTGEYVTGVVSATGNVTGGNVLTSGLISATGNATAGNVLTGGLVSAAGTITSDANITGGNLLTGGNVSAVGDVMGLNLGATGFASITGNVLAGNLKTGGLISATGNATAGNVLTGGEVSATANVTGGNILTGGLVSAGGNITSATNVNTPNVVASGNLTAIGGNILLEPSSGNIIVNNTHINGVAQPVQSNDVATKIYVDNMVSTQIAYHPAVQVATTANLATTTGGTITYNQPNGAGNGIGATITTTGSFNLIDTANVQTANTRILVKNEGNAALNGVYVWSNATVITRASDADQYGPNSSDELSINDYFFVQSGNVNAGSAYIVDSPAGTITFGTSNISFAQFSSSQTYTGGNGISLYGTVISTVYDNSTIGVNGSNQLYIPANAPLTTPNIGAATGTSLSVTGTVTAATLSSTGNTIAGNVTTVGLVSATGDITGGNILTGGAISAAGNVTANPASFFIGNGSQLTGVTAVSAGFPITAGTSNLNATTNGNITVTVGGTANVAVFATTGEYVTGEVSATGNVTGGNVLTGGLISATGNATAGNVLTGGLVSATGSITSDANITGGNILTGGLISATGNITGGNILYGSGLISGTGNIYGANLIVSNIESVTGNITGGNILTGGEVSATANITGGNVLTSGLISATGNATAGNFLTAGLVSATANITGGNLLTSGLVSATGSGTFGNIVISGDDITDTNGRVNFNTAGADVDFAVNGDTVANVFYVDAGTGTASFGSATQTTNAIVAFNSTNSILMPTGNIGTRPSVGVTGMTRFNTTNNALEVYDNSQWTTVGVPSFTVIADEQFNGDGSTVAFTLSSTQTTNSCIVSINGVIQVPGSAYSVAGTDPTCVLTFTEAPASGDLIDVREVTTTTTVTSISNSSGNAVVSVSATSPTTTVTGDLSVTGNINISGNIATTQINNGTSAVQIPTSSGNVYIDVGTTNDLAVFTQTALSMTGNIIPSANITYDLGTSTQRWKDLWLSNSTIYLGNSQISANATSLIFTNPAGGQTVLTGASPSVTGNTVSASGNITGGNILTAGVVSATGNVTGNYILGNGALLTGVITSVANINSGTSNVTVLGSGGNILVGVGGANIIRFTGSGIENAQANATGNIGNATNYFDTVFAKATSAQYADLAEKYVADAEYAAGTVVSFGGDKEVTKSSVDGDRRVAGVVSTNPSYIMNGTLQAEYVATIALTGRVPTSVTGTVAKGDLMVSNGDGTARSEADPKAGAIIGKALENFEGSTGVIEVVIGRF